MAKQIIKYYVVGGQYAPYTYGGAATLNGAKRMATKNAEYWDNWQGWHTPAIFAAEDMVAHECTGDLYAYGMHGTVLVPAPFVRPVAVKVCGRWIDKRDE